MARVLTKFGSTEDSITRPQTMLVSREPDNRGRPCVGWHIVSVQARTDWRPPTAVAQKPYNGCTAAAVR